MKGCSFIGCLCDKGLFLHGLPPVIKDWSSQPKRHTTGPFGGRYWGWGGRWLMDSPTSAGLIYSPLPPLPDPPPRSFPFLSKQIGSQICIYCMCTMTVKVSIQHLEDPGSTEQIYQTTSGEIKREIIRRELVRKQRSWAKILLAVNTSREGWSYGSEDKTDSAV